MREIDDKSTIEDDYGESHQYYVQQHPAGEGFRLLIRLVRMAGGALGRTWGAFSPSEIGEKIGEIAEELKGGLDGDSLASAFEKLATQILEEGADDFVVEILKHSARDGQKITRAIFDSAYSGNYGELLSAIYLVLRVNYGPFLQKRLGGFTAGAPGILSKLTAKLQTLEKQLGN